MRRHKVENSSAVKSIGHDSTTKIMEVELNGGLYHVHPVETHEYVALFNGNSIGQAYHKLVGEVDVETGLKVRTIVKVEEDKLEEDKLEKPEERVG